MRPDVSGSNPVIRLTVVLLPEPFGPISPKMLAFLHAQRELVDGAYAAEVPGQSA